MKEYVIQRDGGYYISDSRISLDSVVYAFQRGASPESIRRSFPLLTLEEIYGAITFYLSHQQEIDSYLKEGEAEFEELRRKSRESNPNLHEKFKASVAMVIEELIMIWGASEAEEYTNRSCTIPL